MSWFYSGLAPDDLVGYGDIEEALDALIAASTSPPPGALSAVTPCRDAARAAPDDTHARLPEGEPQREDGPTRG